MSYIENRAYGHAAEEEVLRKLNFLHINACRIQTPNNTAFGDGPEFDTLKEIYKQPDIYACKNKRDRFIEVKHLKVATWYDLDICNNIGYWSVIMNLDAFERYMQLNDFLYGRMAIAWHLDGGIGINCSKPSPNGTFIQDVSVLKNRVCYKHEKANKVYFKVKDLEKLDKTWRLKPLVKD